MILVFCILTCADEVIDPGNQVHCEQSYLDGLMFEMAQIKDTMLNDGGGFNTNKDDSANWDSKPFVEQAFANTKALFHEFKRLHSHPELFRDDVVREKFYQEFKPEAKVVGALIRRIESEEVWKRDRREEVAQREKAEKIQRSAVTSGVKAVPVAQAAPITKASVVDQSECQPWQSWCRQLPFLLQNNTIKVTLEDFRHKNPGLMLVGTQLIPHMGVLIAEHWRLQVEAIVVGITNVSAMRLSYSKHS
jgi:hypothetical protein